MCEALVAHALDPQVVYFACQALQALATAENIPLVAKPQILRAGAIKACKSAAATMKAGSLAYQVAESAGDALVLLHKLTRHIKQHDVRRADPLFPLFFVLIVFVLFPNRMRGF